MALEADVESAKTDFMGLVNRLDLRQQAMFVVWLDNKLAEFKTIGTFSGAGEQQAMVPRWLRSFMLLANQENAHSLRSAMALNAFNPLHLPIKLESQFHPEGHGMRSPPAPFSNGSLMESPVGVFKPNRTRTDSAPCLQNPGFHPLPPQAEYPKPSKVRRLDSDIASQHLNAARTPAISPPSHSVSSCSEPPRSASPDSQPGSITRSRGTPTTAPSPTYSPPPVATISLHQPLGIPGAMHNSLSMLLPPLHLSSLPPHAFPPHSGPDISLASALHRSSAFMPTGYGAASSVQLANLLGRLNEQAADPTRCPLTVPTPQLPPNPPLTSLPAAPSTPEVQPPPVSEAPPAPPPPPPAASSVEQSSPGFTRRIPCPDCGACFEKTSEYKTHLTSVHGRQIVYPKKRDNGDVKWHCAVCTHPYRHNKDAHRHYTSKHIAAPYVCDQCHSTFQRRDALQRHLKKMCPAKASK